jgi:hypothetical protein
MVMVRFEILYPVEKRVSLPATRVKAESGPDHSTVGIFY